MAEETLTFESAVEAAEETVEKEAARLEKPAEDTPAEETPAEETPVEEAKETPEPEATTETEPEAPPAEEAAEGEPSEQEVPAAPAAPGIIQRHRPELVGLWTHLTSEQREGILNSVADQVEQAATKAGVPDGRQGDEGEAEELAEPDRASEGAQPATSLPQVPKVEPLSDDDFSPLLEYFADDDKATQALKALQSRVNTVSQWATEVGELALIAIRDQEARLGSFEEQTALENAMVAHQGEITLLYGPHAAESSWQELAEKAAEVHKAGRVGKNNWEDAVALAIRDIQKNKRSPGASASPQAAAARSKRARLASSLGTGPRTVRPTTRKIAQTLEEAGEQAEEDMAHMAPGG